MPVTLHHEDTLAHIPSTKADEGVTTTNPAPGHTLEARSAVSDSCITLLSFAGASIKVCYSISGDNITISVVLSTPLGDITIGKAVLNAQNPTVTLGGGFAGFKAEVTLSYDVKTSVLTIEGKVCAPLAGCKSGSVHIHL